MSDTRVFLDGPLAAGQQLELPEGAFRHLIQVLRMSAGETLTVFDGRGGEYRARLVNVAKRSATLQVDAYVEVDRESTLDVTLVQGISKGERMDWTLQKAVELGVRAVVPVISERCNVQLDGERRHKRQEHWQGVIVSACEQSGRTRVPELRPVCRLADWWAGAGAAMRTLLLDPQAPAALATLELGPDLDAGAPLALVVGPEGGLSPAEIAAGIAAGACGVRLGPRVLRTETAGMAALAVLQASWGDLR